jgi:endoglucanase Acf2
VASAYDHAWGRKWHQHVLTLIRDIANPSDKDEFFPKWRHKDWYLGASWASGIVLFEGKPYPNGRNQESSSEVRSVYAMCCDVMRCDVAVMCCDASSTE